MKLLTWYIASLLIMAVISAPMVDWSKENSWSTFTFPVFGFSPILLGVITLWADKGRATKADANGEMHPIYQAHVEKRSIWGHVLFWGSAIVLLLATGIGSTGVPYNDVILAPALPALLIGGYLLLTPRCPYCFRANVPRSKKCADCNSYLQVHEGET